MTKKIFFPFVFAALVMYSHHNNLVQAQTNSDVQINTRTANGVLSKGTGAVEEELSSAITAPTSPGLLIASASGFGFMGDCVKDTPCTTNSTALNAYGSLAPSSASTLTYTFSSPPPGPFLMSLDNATWFTIDSQIGVVKNASPWTSLFPAALGTIYLKTEGYWSPPSGTGYPWLQYFPESITLIYQ